MQNKNELDPVYSSDRKTGSTPPETGDQSSNIVGRPVDAADHAVGFHEQTENESQEREAFAGEEALREGGSFDGLGVPVANDTDR